MDDETNTPAEDPKDTPAEGGELAPNEDTPSEDPKDEPKGEEETPAKE